jgi:hypothetical protein
MRSIAPAIALTAISAAACSMPTKTLVEADAPVNLPPDASAGRFACHNIPTPTTAPPQVTISGKVQAAVTGAAVSGASVELFEAGSSLPPVVVGQDGMFSFQLATAGAPADVHLRVTDNDYLTTFYYPAEFVTKDITIFVQMFTTPIATSVLGDMGVTFDPTKVQFLIGAVDCNEDPLAGATVTTLPSVAVHYFIDTPNPTPDKMATVTDTATGAADASMSLTMHSHPPIDAGGAQGALVQTEIRP